ncbi:MAG: flagellar biosynthesis protein FlhB [Candidatus Eiseniibacteriota bacterium]
MAQDPNGQERTESATPKRRERAREDGHVARSVDLASAAVLAASLGALAATGKRMVEGAGGLLRETLENLGRTPLDVASVGPLLAATALAAAAMLGPFVAIVAAAGIAAHVSQVGFLLTTKPLMPKLDRISPQAGLKRILAKRSLVELAKSLLKLVIVGSVLFWITYSASEDLLPLMSAGVLPAYQAVLSAMFRMVSAAALALAVLAILDFFFQRWDYEQQIRMTRQEIKEEMKQNEGDPHIKGKVRARQQELSRRRMMQDVRTADVVVTNPVHFAVALKYDVQRMVAPRVVAKGRHLLARRIRDAALGANVPVVENPPLARALYQTCKVGAEVPLSLYQAVAEVLAFVYRRRDAVHAGGLR